MSTKIIKTLRDINHVQVRRKIMETSVIKTSEVEAEVSAVKVLKSGGVIALPTDTVYGFACSATNIAAISKLYTIKSRNENKPVAICLGRELDIQKWAEVSHLPNGLLNSLLPGPVTLILKCANKLDKSLVFNGKVGIRIPDFDFIRDVANRLGCPIALTSANLSSQPSTVKIDEFSILWDQLDAIYDGGCLGVGDSNRLASTIVDISTKGMYNVVRDGIAIRETIDVLKKYGLVSIN